jgi:hypothetical protein
VYGFGMDLREIFEGWLRSRVAGERPGVAPGSVTEGGYEMDAGGMRRWRADTAEFVVWLGENDPKMFGEFRYRYNELDPEGWKALVGFGGEFHDEAQLDRDVDSLVNTPVDDGVPAVSMVLPPPPTTTTTAPPVSTTVPPRTTPVTPDTGFEVVAPPTTTESPARPYDPNWPMAPRQPPPSRPPTWPGASWERPPEVPVEEEHGHHSNIGQGFERLIGHPDAEVDHSRSIHPGKSGSSLMPTRDQWSQAGWDPVFNFVGSLVGGLFDLFGGEDEEESLTEVYGTDRPEMRFAELEGGWHEKVSP